MSSLPPDPTNQPNERTKALTSVVAAVALATGANVSPENAQTIATVAALAIPFLPSAYRGIAQIAATIYSGRAKRRK
jgi:hypothetical protein